MLENTIYPTLLGLHIFCGFASLLFGGLNIIREKGTAIHIRFGNIYYHAMIFVCFTAIGIAIIKPNLFLFTIAIFAFYQNYSGRRAIKNKSLIPSTTDKIILIIAILNSFLMLYTQHLILLILGGISLFLAINQTITFRKAQLKKALHPKQWLKMHIGMIIGAYIATFTAFIVVNVNYIEPVWVPWLAPTFVFVPIIIYWTRKIS